MSEETMLDMVSTIKVLADEIKPANKTFTVSIELEFNGIPSEEEVEDFLREALDHNCLLADLSTTSSNVCFKRAESCDVVNYRVVTNEE
tara:strand:- start:1685 stop:1951 length:267 start_codon:yes stop_codon:yes gene_type:complete